MILLDLGHVGRHQSTGLAGHSWLAFGAVGADGAILAGNAGRAGRSERAGAALAVRSAGVGRSLRLLVRLRTGVR